MIKLTLQTWVTTCLLGTIALAIYFLGQTHGDSEQGTVMAIGGIAVLVSMAITLPALIGFNIFGRYLKERMPLEQVKLLSSLYALVAIGFSTFICSALVNEGIINIDYTVYLFGLPYAVSFIISIWIFRWPVVPQEMAGAELLDNEVETYQPLFPVNDYYIIIAIVGLELLYSMYNWGTYIWRGLTSRGMFTAYTILSLVNTLLIITGLILFIRKRNEGWKILALTVCMSLTTSVISMCMNIVSFGSHIEMMTWFLVPFFVFILLDVVMTIFLRKPVLRSYYSINEKTANAWMLAGVGLGTVQMIAQQFMLRF